MTAALTLRAVVFEENGRLVAQCLEADICTSAGNRRELVRKLKRQVSLQIALDLARGIEPLGGLPRSPQKFWDLYSRSRTPAEVLPIRNARPGLRSLVGSWRPAIQASLSLATA